MVTVTGTVLNESGSGIAGANIVVDDTDLGAASDESGEFSIDGVMVGSSLTISVIGYVQQTVLLTAMIHYLLP